MTTTYDRLDTINDSLNDIKIAIIGKGQTPSGNITTYATAIDNIVQSSPVIQSLSITPTTSAQTLNVNSGYSGNGTISVSAVTSSIDANITAENIKKDVTILGVTGSLESGGGEFQLTRVKDDNNVEIGTHYMDFTDGNGNKYKVVCLDAQYRLAAGQWCSTQDVITDLPTYRSWSMWEAKETSTFNTQKILDYCNSHNQTSSACSHCRSKSFTIDGTTYYGQLPNIIELVEIGKHYTDLNNLDTSGSSFSSLKFPRTNRSWSSTQYGEFAWYLGNSGNVGTYDNPYTYFVCPVLEIPY